MRPDAEVPCAFKVSSLAFRETGNWMFSLVIFFDALGDMNAVIEDNVNAHRSGELRRSWSFEAWSRQRFLCRIASGGD
jgi:hypothetical protein